VAAIVSPERMVNVTGACADMTTPTATAMTTAPKRILN
jgi:hypothetical protein